MDMKTDVQPNFLSHCGHTNLFGLHLVVPIIAYVISTCLFGLAEQRDWCPITKVFILLRIHILTLVVIY